MSVTCAILRSVLLLSILAGCSDAAAPGDPREPEKIDDGWEVASPGRFGANLALLDSMIHGMRAGEYVNIHSIVVVKDGVLVLEEYSDGQNRDTLHEIRSATKSIGSMLTGIAIDKGFLQSEKEPIYKYFEGDYKPSYGWSPQAKQVEICHLLSMMSGYDCDDLATDFACEDAMYQTDDWVQYSLDLPFAHEPGQHWAYNSSSLILLGEAIARESGMKLEEFADRYLFEPLGIEKFRWSFSPKRRAWIGGGARMIPREMAKIGLLMLNRGVWEGRRLLSEEWIEKSTTKQGDMQAGVDYGYLWQSGEAFIEKERARAYWASGNGGQYIIVLPQHEMVIVFTGGNYNSRLAGQPFEMLVRYILPAFLNPRPLEIVDLSRDQMEKLTGVYELDFERSATSTISIDDGGVRLLSPDGESIRLVPHSCTLFTGDSGYGPITVVFDYDGNGDAVRHTVYGSFQRFEFERR